MKVQGVDQTILNRIQEKVRQRAVQESERVVITDNQRRRSRQQKRDADADYDLELIVEKLNEAGENLGIDLTFAVCGQTPAVVLVLEKDTGKIISRLPAEKARNLLGELQNHTGLMVEYYL